MIPNEEINRLLEISKIGDDFKNFKENGGYAMLEKYILTPFEQGAFDAFQDVLASDIDAVTMTQAMGKIIKTSIASAAMIMRSNRVPIGLDHRPIEQPP